MAGIRSFNAQEGRKLGGQRNDEKNARTAASLALSQTLNAMLSTQADAWGKHAWLRVQLTYLPAEYTVWKDPKPEANHLFALRPMAWWANSTKMYFD